MNNKKDDNRTEKRKTGDLGEDVACVYLKKNGYSIVDRNYLRKYGELDIVAKKGSIYYFIEVKSVTRETVSGRPQASTINGRRETDEYRPEDNVHPWKIKRLRRTIQAYILEKHISYDWEFGVITVFLNMKTRKAKVSFMENIVL